MDYFWQIIARNAGPIQALCAIATVAIAAIAAIIALRQLAAGYRIHREQAQPYVAAGMRPLQQVDLHFIEFFIHNFGQTAAFNVRIISDPPLQVVWQGEEPHPMWIFETLPTLVPGDEWTQMVGFAPSHFEEGLPLKYDLTVDWQDSNGTDFSAKYVLDWNAHRNRESLTRQTVHHLAKTAEDVHADLEGIHAALTKIVNNQRVRNRHFGKSDTVLIADMDYETSAPAQYGQLTLEAAGVRDRTIPHTTD